MECKKRDYVEILEQKRLKRSAYNNRKECIKKKTMELATLCGINACTVIYGAYGEIESWPENSTQVEATIKKFKDLTNNPNKRVIVRDESQKRVVDVPGGEVVDGEVHSRGKSLGGSNVGKTFDEKAEISHLTKMVERSSLYSRGSSLTGYQDFLKQLDSKLEALTKRIQFLRRDQELDVKCCCVENKQLDYSEENKRLFYSEKTSPSPKRRRRIKEEPLFLFDLNYPPPDEQ
ncbi:MADS-box domain-containing protein [Heracleum sosnowskyi]|uniref:MADS-box domain-containing protein n=1 Tax=Heracleum sosnowskyi TaxID=360622 RepID=A0AAD8ML30_9APIA|nr:MADS-box domain-containing protein [Heracleum sosnowskyi]